MDIKFRGDDL